MSTRPTARNIALDGPAALAAAPDTLQDGYTYDPAAPPPPFGHAMRKYFAFEDGYVNVNHGSYGSLPLPVLAECNKLTLLAERNPDRFHRATYMPMLAEARAQVAALIGAHADEVVFVPNTTHGINTVLRNIEWREGDVLLKTTITYGAVARTVQYLADRREGPRPTAHTLALAYPAPRAAIVDAFRGAIRAHKAAAAARGVRFDVLPTDTDLRGRQNRLVVVLDAIVSVPGVAVPWRELVRVCAEEGAWSVVDAAHALGQELRVDVGAAQPDFWVSNCHKWLYAKRGCAALYVPKRNQHLIRSSIPTSHEYPDAERVRETNDTHFVLQHEWTGTMDFIPYLSVPHALAFRKWLGGEEKINEYCHKLAFEGGKRLAEILGTRVLDETGEATFCMTNVQLPLPVEETGPNAGTVVYTPEIKAKLAHLFQDRCFNKYNTYIMNYYHNGAIWCRISVQVWIEMSDFEYVGKVIQELCKEARETILKQDA